MNSKKATLGLLVFYLAALAWIILFKLQFSFKELSHIRNINLIPFKESVIVNGKLDFDEIIQNVLAFIPLGVFIHVIWEEKPVIFRIIPIILTSLILEIIQFIFAIGATDITDIITNSSGGIIGIAIAFAMSKILKNNWKKCINIISLICAILLTLFIAVLLLANNV